MTRIMVAMSGGVDSSLVAALLHEQGYDVVGITMRLLGTGCYNSDDAITAAQKVCHQMGIAHHVLDCQAAFAHHVIEYFIQEYAQGATPNPCIACNRTIKFDLLWNARHQVDCAMMATGHYVQIASHTGAEGTTRYDLCRGKDNSRDQSYVLYMLQQHQLAHLCFPLGAMNKIAVREQATKRGLATAHRSESQDICFIPDKDYRRFLSENAPDMFIPGPIINQQGQEIGQHKGLPHYTVGQRKGLGIASTEPLFVTALDAERNALVVGTAQDARWIGCLVAGASFVNGQQPNEAFDCLVQVRAHATPAAANATPIADGEIRITFAEPQPAITPGQAAVMYDADRVIGGGRIVKSEPR